jgi:hypothetical protein
LACDEHVVSRLGATEPQAYGAVLLKILGIVGNSSSAPIGLSVVASKRQIKRRIQMIVSRTPHSLARAVLSCTVIALVALLCLTRESLAQQPTSVVKPPDAPAAGRVTTHAPDGWMKNGIKMSDYVTGVDYVVTHDGAPSAYVRSIKPEIDGFGGMMQMCKAANYSGKRVRFSAWMKTEDANDGGAHLWFRVDGIGDEMLQFDNMDPRAAKGTTDWRNYAVVLDVPDGAKALAYGYFVAGTGKAWVSGVKVEEVGTDVPSTNTYIKKRAPRRLPDGPVNLGLTGGTPGLTQ